MASNNSNLNRTLDKVLEELLNNPKFSRQYHPSHPEYRRETEAINITNNTTPEHLPSIEKTPNPLDTACRNASIIILFLSIKYKVLLLF